MKMYLVFYTQGRYEDYHVVDLFVTADEKKARAYADKFNRLLNRLKEWNFDEDSVYYYSDSLYDKLDTIHEINGCHIAGIEVR